MATVLDTIAAWRTEAAQQGDIQAAAAQDFQLAVGELMKTLLPLMAMAERRAGGLVEH